ncbi:MAG: flagellin FliC [Kofleriaceae bacterium]|nr:flagellin FliC [Myxococcales bacterium]MCB9562628.1 flagellin FliC [Kofleriaceae bacterium]MCB9574562.1 flagellin FliC [Kofleriaceae bacterium]
MSITVGTNAASLNAQRNLAGTQRSLAANLGRLSSGMRINSASDDAAGLGISERLKAQIRGLSQASRNANDGVSMSQVAEGAMNEQAGILTRLRELAVQGANGTLGASERGYISAEATELTAELDRISTVTEFNGVKMLGADAGTISMQVGIHGTADDRIDLTFAATDSTTLGVNALNFATQAGAQGALATIDTAIDSLSSSRATIGASQNRLVVTMNNLSSAHENLSAANSRIRDVDVAEETASMTRNQILSQAGVAVLAQANQLPQAALSLLRG